MQTYKDILNFLIKSDESIHDIVNSNSATYKTFDGIPKKYLLIKFYNNVPRKLKETVFYEMKNLIDDSAHSYLIDDFVQSSEKFVFASEIFFLVIGFVSVVLSFFLILISFYSNIKDNICEYGILRYVFNYFIFFFFYIILLYNYRAIGLSKNQSLRVYLYEASVIMITSILMGTFIGMVISVTLIMQFNLFSEIPFEIAVYYFIILFYFVLYLLYFYIYFNKISFLLNFTFL
jgi:hypothetical protein